MEKHVIEYNADKEKLLWWLENLEFPRIEFNTEEADTIYADAREAFRCVIDDIRTRAEAL